MSTTFNSNRGDAGSTTASVTTVAPSAGGAGIQTALQAASDAGGGIVQLLPGTYAIADSTGGSHEGLVFPSDASNVHLVGSGPETILSSSVTTVEYTVYMNQSFAAALTGQACSNIAANDTQITLTTVANAASFLIGMPVLIQGTDTDSFPRYTMAEVLATGNGTTGVVTLKAILKQALTSVTVQGYATGRNNSVRDLKIVHAAGASHAIGVKGQVGAVIERVIMDGTGFSGSYAVEFGNSAKCRIRDCEIANYNLQGISANGDGLVVGTAAEILIENVLFQYCGYTSGEAACILTTAGSENISIKNCKFRYNNAQAIKLHSSYYHLSWVIDGCTFDNNKGSAISCGSKTQHKNIRVTNSIFRTNGNSDIILNALHSSVSGCTFSRNKLEAGIEAPGDYLTIANNNFNNALSENLYIKGTFVSVVGNTFYGGPNGIYFDTGATNCSVVGNTITGHSSYGIRLDAGSAITISGNTSVTNTTKDLIIANGCSNIMSIGNNYQGGAITLGSGTNINSIGDLL